MENQEGGGGGLRTIQANSIQTQCLPPIGVRSSNREGLGSRKGALDVPLYVGG